jgi:hypothetical protein
MGMMRRREMLQILLAVYQLLSKIVWPLEAESQQEAAVRYSNASEGFQVHQKPLASYAQPHLESW